MPRRTSEGAGTPGRCTWGVLLAPGAGSGRDHPSLVAIEAAVCASGGSARRMDFPYRLAGRRAPDRQPVLVGAVAEEAGSFARDASLAPDRVFVGGRSMGGRMCSLAVAQGLTAAGLVLVSYPLHPPGRPDRLRTEHFSLLNIPCLFVSGTRDAFGSPGEIEAALTGISGTVTLHWLPGGDHGLRGRDQEVAEIVASWTAGLARPG